MLRLNGAEVLRLTLDVTGLPQSASLLCAPLCRVYLMRTCGGPPGSKFEGVPLRGIEVHTKYATEENYR